MDLTFTIIFVVALIKNTQSIKTTGTYIHGKWILTVQLANTSAHTVKSFVFVNCAPSRIRERNFDNTNIFNVEDRDNCFSDNYFKTTKILSILKQYKDTEDYFIVSSTLSKYKTNKNSITTNNALSKYQCLWVASAVYGELLKSWLWNSWKCCNYWDIICNKSNSSRFFWLYYQVKPKMYWSNS